MNLSHKDYITLLNYYKIPDIKKMKNKEVKILAENILADKLCRCIKKVTKKNKLPEPSAIAICKKSVITRKNIKINRFSCKNKPKLIPNKKTRKNIQKLKTTKTKN